MKKAKYFILPLFLCIICIIKGGANVEAAGNNEEVNVRVYAMVEKDIMVVGTTLSISTEATINDKRSSNLIYETDNEKIATVSKKGKISAIAPGKVFIKAYIKGYPDNYSGIYMCIVDKIIKITGPKKYEAGNTYQLKASVKNVEWYIANMDGDNAQASIDQDTGKIKIRNAGIVLVSCYTKDGKSIGKVYIYATGPIIEKQVITLKSIKITEDLNLVSFADFEALGLLPEKISAPYSYGTKTGKVDIAINWEVPYYDDDEFGQGENTLNGFGTAPEGYAGGNTHVQIVIDVATEQTDNRKKIVKLEPTDNITLSKDEHLTYIWDVATTYIPEMKIKGVLEDGSIVEVPIYSIGQGMDFYGEKGTYKFELNLKNIAGYSIEEDLFPELALEVTKKQTIAKRTLDDIAGEAIVTEYTTQKEMGK